MPKGQFQKLYIQSNERASERANEQTNHKKWQQQHQCKMHGKDNNDDVVVVLLERREKMSS